MSETEAYLVQATNTTISHYARIYGSVVGHMFSTYIGCHNWATKKEPQYVENVWFYNIYAKDLLTHFTGDNNNFL